MRNGGFAAAMVLLAAAGCAQPAPREPGPLRPFAGGPTGESPVTLSGFLEDPPSISWKSPSIFRKRKQYLSSTDSSAPSSYLAEGEFHFFDAGNVRISYTAVGDGFVYREVTKREVSFRPRAWPTLLLHEARVENHDLFVAFEAVCNGLPCAGTVRVYDAYQPLPTSAAERHISLIWGHGFLGKPLPEDVTLKREERFPVSDGSEMGGYLVDQLRFVADGVAKIKRENPRLIFPEGGRAGQP